ncbi:unnamed protein product [Boreogadus saida]
MKMNPWNLSVLLLLAGPLGADPDWHVEHPDSFCVVEGSTATIPCSFTHPTGLRVKRVVWCPNHTICHLTTPNVYDSSNLRADSRFLYLGDLVSDCTLKIIKTVKRDAATYHFRFETNGRGWAGQKGVIVTVTEEKSGWRLTVSVVSVLLAVFLLLAGLVFAKRRHAQKTASEVIQKQEVERKQEAVGTSEEVSYSIIHLKPSSSRSAPGPEHEIVYSEVVG